MDLFTVIEEGSCATQRGAESQWTTRGEEKRDGLGGGYFDEAKGLEWK